MILKDSQCAKNAYLARSFVLDLKPHTAHPLPTFHWHADPTGFSYSLNVVLVSVNRAALQPAALVNRRLVAVAEVQHAVLHSTLARHDVTRRWVTSESTAMRDARCSTHSISSYDSVHGPRYLLLVAIPT